MNIKDDFTKEEIYFDDIETTAHNNENSESSNIVKKYIEIAKLNKAQYKQIKNEKLIRLIKDHIYEDIKYAAFLSHGKCELEIDDKEELCYITLYSKYLFINDELAISKSKISDILKLATWTKVSVDGEYVKYQFMFQLYETVKVKDYSQKIEQLKKEIKEGSQK